MHMSHPTQSQKQSAQNAPQAQFSQQTQPLQQTQAELQPKAKTQLEINVKTPHPEAVRELAYWLWEQAGRPEGQSERFWVAAEDKLSRRLATSD
jgi:hypothetical protein